VREVLDGLSKPGRLVEGDEGVAVWYLDEPSLGEELGETASMLGRHDAVLACPDDEGRALEAGQAFGRVEHEMALCRDPALVAGFHRVAAARSLGLTAAPVVIRDAQTEDADRAVENITSCRCRHDVIYADCVVMPMSVSRHPRSVGNPVPRSA
jgi:hypothetical protein